MNQEEWKEKNYKGIEPWVCSCGKFATLHRTNKNGKHEFLCNKCIKKERGGWD